MYFKSEYTGIPRKAYILLAVLLVIYFYGRLYHAGLRLPLTKGSIFVVVIVYPVAIIFILFIVRKLINSYFSEK